MYNYILMYFFLLKNWYAQNYGSVYYLVYRIFIIILIFLACCWVLACLLTTTVYAQEVNSIRPTSKGALLIKLALTNDFTQHLFGYGHWKQAYYEKVCYNTAAFFNGEPFDKRYLYPEIAQRVRMWQHHHFGIGSENFKNLTHDNYGILFTTPQEYLTPFLLPGEGGDVFLRDSIGIIPLELKYRWVEFSQENNIQKYMTKVNRYDMPILLDCNSKIILDKILPYIENSPNLFIKDASFLYHPVLQVDENLYNLSRDVINNFDTVAFEKAKKEFLTQIKESKLLSVVEYKKRPVFKFAIQEY